MQASKRVRGADENTGAAAAAVQQGKTAALVEELLERETRQLSSLAAQAPQAGG